MELRVCRHRFRIWRDRFWKVPVRVVNVALPRGEPPLAGCLYHIFLWVVTPARPPALFPRNKSLSEATGRSLYHHSG